MYQVPIRPRKNTCVGLGLALIRHLRTLEADFPGIGAGLQLASCEEALDDPREYAGAALGPGDLPPAEVEKEHVLMALRVVVDGRAGVLLADPGYHVARVVTVMFDRAYPHTGWFIQSDEAHSKKEYSYSFNATNSNYVDWNERETRVGAIKQQTSLVYVARPYLTAVNVTERRNLIYNFRSLLTRDMKGHLIAGIYFPLTLKDPQFTIFYENNIEKQRIKLKFSMFLEGSKIPDSVVDQISICNSQMKRLDGELLAIIRKMACIVTNTDYITQVLAINDTICQLTSEN